MIPLNQNIVWFFIVFVKKPRTKFITFSPEDTRSKGRSSPCGHVYFNTLTQIDPCVVVRKNRWLQWLRDLRLTLKLLRRFISPILRISIINCCGIPPSLLVISPRAIRDPLMGFVGKFDSIFSAFSPGDAQFMKWWGPCWHQLVRWVQHSDPNRPLGYCRKGWMGNGLQH